MTNTLEKLMKKTVDDAGCLVWQGGHTRYSPSARLHGKTTMIRRAVWEAEHGPIPAGYVINTTCGTPSCVSIDCMTMITSSEMSAINGRKHGGDIKRAAKIARTRRNGPTAKLTDTDVAAIRSSDDSQRELSKKFGVSQAYISSVQRHQARRDFSSPFAGLGARA